MKSHVRNTSQNNEILSSAETSFRTEGFQIRDSVRKDANSVLENKESANIIVQKYINNYNKSK
jgi:hypothetical protein